MRSNRGMATEMLSVTMYTLSGCPYCVRARRLLARRGIAFEEISGDGVPGFRTLLRERTGCWTVPQILICGEPIGGSNELAALDRRGVLTARARGLQFPHPVRRRRIAWRGLPAAIASLLSGRGFGPWRYLVELRDRDGRLVDGSSPATCPPSRASTRSMGG